MTKAELIAALSDLPDDAAVLMEVGGESADSCSYSVQTVPGDANHPAIAVLTPELDPIA